MVATHESNQNESKIVWHKRFYNWMRKNILGILFVLALVLIGSWALYTLDYSYKTISQGVFLLPDDIGRVYYPEHLLLFSEPSAIQVDFTQKTTDPLMFILHFPDTIQAQVSPTMTSRIITLTVAASQTITSTPIVLQNAGMWTGLWNELMGHDESIIDPKNWTTC